MKNSTLLVRFVFLLMMSAAFTLGAQEGSTGKVFFLGIGVEKCQAGIAGKPNAVADVKAVAERTAKDVESGAITYYTQGENKELKQSDGLIKKLLINELATIQAIDSMFAVFSAKATKDDIFYLYIAASSNPENGSFIVPGRPNVKKGAKSTGLVPYNLDMTHLHELCSMIPCDKQIIIQDCEAWGNYHADLSEIFFDGTGNKKQLLITPFTASEDSFECSGKYLSLLATIIYKSDSPILHVFSPFPNKVSSVKEELTGATRALGKKGTCYLFIPSWDANAPPLKANADPITSGKAVEAPKVAPQEEKQPAEQTLVKKESKRGFENTEEDPTAVAMPKVRNYALIIANQNYEHPEVWSPLKNPINDAKAIGAVLEKDFGFEVRICTDLGIDSMYTEINNLQNIGLNENCQVLFYYSGHGNAKKIAGGAVEGYMVPVDGADPLTDKNLRTFIPYNVLQFKLDILPAKHILAIYDACFSGSADQNVIAKEEEPVDKTAAVTAKKATVAVQVFDAMQVRSRHFIASGKFNTVSDGVPGKLSPFANLFINELLEGKKNKEVVYGDAIIGKLKQDPGSRAYSNSFGTNAGLNYFMFIPVSIIPNK